MANAQTDANDASEETVAYDREQAARDIQALSQAEPVTETGPIRTDLSAVWKWIIWTIALSMSLFHLWMGWRGTLPTLESGSIHLAFGLALIFLAYKPRRGREWGLEEEYRGPDVSPATRIRGYLFGTESGRGVIWTALLVGILLYLTSIAEMNVAIIVPSLAVIALVQSTRVLRLDFGGIPVADVVLAVLAVWAAYWIFTHQRQEFWRDEGEFTAAALAAATVGTLLVLVAAVRAVGLALGIVCGLMFAYALYGRAMPDFLYHGGRDPESILETSFLGTTGIFGTPLQVSYTTIFLFMIFAALLQSTGMERFFTNLALALAGKRVGGTAKVGVITSVFSGTITGSSVANTVSNGAFTIPMMRRSGYKRDFAGAVEAASSTGGQIAPPIMGAGAFLMLALIGNGVTYREIMLVAIVPAVLFFTAQFIIVHYVSKREGITGLPKEELPNGLRLLLRQGYLLLPLVVIVVIISSGKTANAAAFEAIFWTIGINFAVQLIFFLRGFLKADADGGRWAAGVSAWKRLDYRLTPFALLQTLVNAAKMALPVVAATAAAGIIAGMINGTGLGGSLGTRLLRLGQDLGADIPFIDNAELYLVLLFTVIACLILGIGLPTTANFVVMYTVAVPTVVELIQPRYDAIGLTELQVMIVASLFVYYYGVLADITPPVCLAAFAAAGISGGSPMKTGVQSVRIAISGFVVPFAFILTPEMLMLGGDWLASGVAIVAAIAGITAIGAAFAGFWDVKLLWYERLGLLAAGALLLGGSWTTDLIGLVVGGLALASHFARKKAGRGETVQPTAG
ncbi:TRAP transporter permease [Haloglycomyces albus]|uniref:TRAP transporter permease n=1 Tax=Haloglycomyces albus TaxID=526067 RepID=UPI00046CB2E0|nr:TRAP transporter fused permease subunit [Haloglycomyces albus]